MSSSIISCSLGYEPTSTDHSVYRRSSSTPMLLQWALKVYLPTGFRQFTELKEYVITLPFKDVRYANAAHRSLCKVTLITMVN